MQTISIFLFKIFRYSQVESMVVSVAFWTSTFLLPQASSSSVGDCTIFTIIKEEHVYDIKRNLIFFFFVSNTMFSKDTFAVHQLLLASQVFSQCGQNRLGRCNTLFFPSQVVIIYLLLIRFLKLLTSANTWICIWWFRGHHLSHPCLIYFRMLSAKLILFHLLLFLQ